MQSKICIKYGMAAAYQIVHYKGAFKRPSTMCYQTAALCNQESRPESEPSSRIKYGMAAAYQIVYYKGAFERHQPYFIRWQLSCTTSSSSAQWLFLL